MVFAPLSVRGGDFLFKSVALHTMASMLALHVLVKDEVYFSVYV